MRATVRPAVLDSRDMVSAPWFTADRNHGDGGGQSSSRRPHYIENRVPNRECKGETGMRFMILRLADKATEAGIMPSQELLAAMGKYMEELAAAGVLLGGEGLQPTSKGARVKFSRGRPTVTHGPFSDERMIAGY